MMIYRVLALLGCFMVLDGKLCPAGRYKHHFVYKDALTYQMEFCAQCMWGFFQPFSEFVGKSCIACPIGKYAAGYSSSSCASCSNGKTSKRAQSSCQACPHKNCQTPAPTHSPTSPTLSPTTGPPTLSPTQIPTPYGDCSSGRFVSQNNTCHDCPYGKYNQLWRQSSCIQCNQCPERQFRYGCDRTSGLGICRRCLPGTFYHNLPLGDAEQDGTRTCLACPPGQYQPDHGQRSCVRCNAKSFQYQPQAAQRSCLRCTRGQYPEPMKRVARHCVRCPETTSPSYHLARDDGTLQWIDDDDQGSGGMSTSTSTSTSTDTTESSLTPSPICVCDGGMRESGDWTDVSPKGGGKTALTCTPCPVGFYRAFGSLQSTICLGCAVGQFQDRERASKCISCPQVCLLEINKHVECVLLVWCACRKMLHQGVACAFIVPYR
jgi:hypothetical protein